MRHADESVPRSLAIPSTTPWLDGSNTGAHVSGAIDVGATTGAAYGDTVGA